MNDPPVTIKITPALIDYLVKNHNCSRVTSGADEETLQNVYGKKVARLLASGELDCKTYHELVIEPEEEGDMKSPDPQKMFGGGGGSDPRVKAPSEMYSDKRASAVHVKTGRPVLRDDGHGEVTLPSELSTAQLGCLVKFLASRSGVGCSLNEHENLLLAETCEGEWSGEVDGQYEKSFRNPSRCKAILDDALSGGVTVVPTVVDTDLISTPLLKGELYPHVDVVTLDRGSRAQANSIGQITVNSGGADNTQIGLFNTAAMIGALPATIWGCDVALELGKDFLSDSIASIGTAVQAEISQAMMAWLDRVIAVGNGVNEPQGITLAAGTTAVACGGVTSVANMLGMLFSVPKAQRGPPTAPSTVFAANELTYQRNRSAAVGPADARIVHGMTVEDWKMFGRPFKVEVNLANTQGFFGDLKKYRMWRRLGMTIETSTAGDYLMRRNLMLLVGRMRFGGRVVLPSSFGVTATFAP